MPRMREEDNMSVVIIGGNEGMVCQYEGICRQHGYRAKIFAKENGSIRKKLGTPDMFILFVNTVSHKMVRSTMQEAKRNRVPVLRCHSSSAAALQELLSAHAGA